MYVQNEKSKGTDPKDILTREEFEKQIKGKQNEVYKKHQVANDWSKYARMINQSKWDSFNKCCADLTQKIDEQLAKLIIYRCEWLQTSLFITMLQDFSLMTLLIMQTIVKLLHSRWLGLMSRHQV